MITVDLDWPTIMQIVTSWHRVKRNGKGRARGRVSANGHGVHITDTEILPREVPVNEDVRRHCGDDIKRIEGDIKGGARNQFLYDQKGDETAGEWVEDLDSLIQLYKQSVTETPTQVEYKELKL